MRHLLILVLLCYTVTLSGTTYYIDPSGNNSNNGSISSPWKTLAYASSKATTSGDIIHVNAGTFTETAQSILAIGVSIEGEGVTSIINSNLSTSDNIANHLILLQSSTLNTNGNQSISYLKLEGNNTAFAAILVLERGNVSIHHCTIQNFFTKGVAFVGADYFTDNEATTKAVGNSFHDNILTNCADYPGTGKDPTGWGRGNIEAGSQKGMLIYNNTIVQTDRGVNNNGFCIKYTGNGYMEGLKIYNNTITKPAYDGATWDFAIELWNNRGGTEIYGNTIQGAIDFGGGGGTNNDAHNYGFMAKVYNNNIGQPSCRSHEENGIYLERAITGGTYIYNNTFKNLSKAIISYTGAGDKFEDVYIYYNIISHIQSLPEDGGGGIVLGVTGGATDVAYNNVHAINNVIIADASKPPAFGIYFYCKGNATNIVARNNIIQGFASNPIYINATGTINSCYIQNNLSYGNGLNSATFDKTPSGPFINSNPTPANPMFVSASDFHLSSNSPAIAAGLHITTPTISTDYENKLIDNIPEIGALEYGTSTTTPVVPVYVSSAIANTTPSLLEMTYNQSFASIIPSASSFSVLVNSVSRTVNTVVISGTKVQLTLANPVVYGDVITASYTQPSANPLQTSSGGLAVALVAQTVTNNVNSINPVYVSSAIANTTPSLLEMTYNLTLANIVPVASSFTVLVNSVVRTINTVVISGTNIQLTLASPIVNGNVVTVSYTQPSANPVQTSSGGKAITLGAQTVTNNVIGLNPVYVSSAIANTTPSLLEMTYNMTLANTVPAASSFSVLVNSVARTINNVVISGTKVQLSLASPIVSGNVVTVSYTQPSANPVQTTSGGKAITLGAQTVTNNVIGVNPVYVSSAIANATPSLLEMTYNQTLASTVPAAASFTVLVNSVARTINTVVISGSKVQLTLASPIVYGNLVTVSYTIPSTNPLQTTAGVQAITIGAQTVTNSVIGVTPVYVSSLIANVTPSLLEMTYNQTLASIVPAATSFTVLVNSVVRTINTVVISGTRVQLTLVSRIASGDIVTVSYIKPAGNPIQTTAGGIATGFTNQPVINNCINVAPTIAITSPVMNSTFTSLSNITINASALDADGTVSMVEYYNGSVKLGSNSVAPYSYTWNNVAAGNYSLTVIATDNLNAKTTSSAVAISVISSNHASNKHPNIRIFNPRKGLTYDNLSTIEIDADASDPDGTISKVEFYNGQSKLVELTSAPYIYTWKDVVAGTYTITAIATDNLNDTTISSPIDFVVGAIAKYDANSDIINLYPNPNNGHFSIDFINPLKNDKSVIIITDLSGKQVYNGPVLKEELSKQFDLSDIRSGMYVMMIKDKEILVTKKFIKK